MLELLKIENGLVKVPNTEGNPFLDTERYFTNTLFTEIIDNEVVPTGLPYQILDPNSISVELEENIILLILSDTTIDGITFTTNEELINYLFK